MSYKYKNIGTYVWYNRSFTIRKPNTTQWLYTHKAIQKYSHVNNVNLCYLLNLEMDGPFLDNKYSSTEYL
jgi:hypothetical protein